MYSKIVLLLFLVTRRQCLAGQSASSLLQLGPLSVSLPSRFKPSSSLHTDDDNNTRCSLAMNIVNSSRNEADQMVGSADHTAHMAPLSFIDASEQARDNMLELNVLVRCAGSRGEASTQDSEGNDVCNMLSCCMDKSTRLDNTVRVLVRCKWGKLWTDTRHRAIPSRRTARKTPPDAFSPSSECWDPRSSPGTTCGGVCTVALVRIGRELSGLAIPRPTRRSKQLELF